jgi:hypothetical protein
LRWTSVIAVLVPFAWFDASQLCFQRERCHCLLPHTSNKRCCFLAHIYLLGTSVPACAHKTTCFSIVDCCHKKLDLHHGSRSCEGKARYCQYKFVCFLWMPPVCASDGACRCALVVETEIYIAPLSLRNSSRPAWKLITCDFG